jgi:hypothetical protein
MWLRCGDAVWFRDVGCASLQSGTGPRAPDSTAIVAVEGRRGGEEGMQDEKQDEMQGLREF